MIVDRVRLELVVLERATEDRAESIEDVADTRSRESLAGELVDQEFLDVAAAKLRDADRPEVGDDEPLEFARVETSDAQLVRPAASSADVIALKPLDPATSLGGDRGRGRRAHLAAGNIGGGVSPPALRGGLCRERPADLAAVSRRPRPCLERRCA